MGLVMSSADSQHEFQLPMCLLGHWWNPENRWLLLSVIVFEHQLINILPGQLEGKKKEEGENFNSVRH